MAEEIEEVASALTNDAAPVVVDHRDDVNADVAAAMASLKTAGEPPLADETIEPVEDTRARGPDGKFIPKEAAPEAAAVPDPKLPTAESQTKPSEQPSTAQVAAPVSWSADAKQAWASIPPAVQQAVLKREQEASNGIRQYSEKTARYEQALAPIAQEATRRGMSPDDAIKRLIDGNAFLETQPAQAILWLAQKNGIDLAELASNPPAPQQQARPDPVYAQVSQTVESLQQRVQQFEFNNNLTVAQQFAASKPHYADVEEQLPEFIKELKMLDPSLTGLPLLEKAYDRAIWLNPDVRAKITASERAEVEKAKLANVAAKSTQASKAAISIKGSSATALPPKQAATAGGDAYDDVRQAIHQLRAG